MEETTVKKVPEEVRLNEELRAIDTFIENFSEKHHIPFDEVLKLLSELRAREKSAFIIPSFILREKKLGILESVTKYLKEEFKMSYHDVAKLLKRDERVVWVTYNKAIRKKRGKLVVKEPNYWLPVSIFTDKNLGPLESIALYLRDKAHLSFNEIAKMLDRDNRTIWACYHKGKGKIRK
jgi:hypothetical protein